MQGAKPMVLKPAIAAGVTAPFMEFRAGIRKQGPLRAAVTAAYRRAEEEAVAPLLAPASLPDAAAKRVAAWARMLVEALRAKDRHRGVEGVIQEYSLSSQEGVALMCLAEALLRVPDDATRDDLIRDKISTGDWRAHLGHSPSLFVNAATWGLVVTGRLTATTSETNLSAALGRLIARGGEPLIRRGVDLAVRMLGEQFVAGQTIEEALANGRPVEARGFRHSYDMLGEAATTTEDAERYLGAYETAIHAIGQASAGRGVYDGPGISIKLSALHPRYSRTKIGRVMTELLPRVERLARLAKHYSIGLNIDAEEADRLEISLDLLEALALDRSLAGWNGIGFVVQAYQKRCPFVIDWLIDLARRSGHRIMVRLVKGAYWDAEIKRAQVEGLSDFPVFTRKVHTDVCYLACARKLLAAPDAVFPQFATHNTQTLAKVFELAGPNFAAGQYEFQCLHGMGEPLYEEVVGPDRLDRPCRIYAPVGTHATLLAYLVRRLLENGANSSFVYRVADENVAVEDLIADPVATVRKMPVPGMPHEKILLPRDLFGPDRPNSAGLDLSNEIALAALADAAAAGAQLEWKAVPTNAADDGQLKAIFNPADRSDVVGWAREATPDEIERALAAAAQGASHWAAAPAAQRADRLRQAADALEERMPVLIGLIIREAGKSYGNAVAEVREAVDFLRYYASEIVHTLGADRYTPLGPVVCISPWNFPLSIFTGQIAAALAAGNTVLAKPAEETPLIAAEAVRVLHAVGVPRDVLQLVPGAGKVGAALVGDVRVQGVLFTGSLTVARLIQRQLGDRLTPDGQPIPLIAETGGINAMIVDSSALAEQVVADVITSAFDSAGQRCSALRILCLQEDIAERTLAMLHGAMRELEVGNPSSLSVDVGPVITEEARQNLESHCEAMQSRGYKVSRLPLPDIASRGTFVPPTIIEVGKITDVEREVFGPVLHVLHYRRHDLDRLVDDINAAGYGLTFGLHTRIDETIARVTQRIEAGNIYVNRNMIGAVVGVQPFGGSGLSGTGPKAGGPLYLTRLARAPSPHDTPRGMDGAGSALAMARAYAAWLREAGYDEAAERCVFYLSRSALGAQVELAGPVGERNVYTLRRRGEVAALAATETGLLIQIGAILATGNIAVVEAGNPAALTCDQLPAALKPCVRLVRRWQDAAQLRAVLFEGDAVALLALNKEVAEREGPILSVQAATSQSLLRGDADYDLNRLLEECSISTNTAAAGGNASLMTIG